MQLEISKCSFSHNFHCRHIQRYDNTGYHDQSKCLLEYINDKLACLVPKITYCIQTLSKHSCVLGLQFKQSVKAPGSIVR